MSPQSIRAPGWHSEHQTPVVDGKYIDPKTGKVCVATDDDHAEYNGPPVVDIIVRSQHIDTVDCMWRAPRAFRMEIILCNIMKVVEKEQVEVDSVMATPYSIRVFLTHELTTDRFYEIARAMTDDFFEVECEGQCEINE